MKNLTRIYESDLDFGIGAHTLKVNKDAKEAETKTNKKDSQRQRRIIQNDILLLSRDLIKNGKISKPLYNKMYNVSIGASRLPALQDIYSGLLQIKDIEIKQNALKKHEFKQIKQEKKKERINPPIDKIHLTAKIRRIITFTKTNGKVYKYLEGHDSLLDSRVILATSKQAAEKIMRDEIDRDYTAEEYSSAAKYGIISIEFIDDISESSMQGQTTGDMPMRQSGHVEYNFTKEEKKFLTEKNDKCVIDNLIGLYGTKLNINENDLISLNKKFHNISDDEVEFIESNLGDKIVNPNYKQQNYNVEESYKAFLENCEEDIENFKIQIEHYEKLIIDHPKNKDAYMHIINNINYEIDKIKAQMENEKTNFMHQYNNNTYNIKNAFTPKFVDYFCRHYDISHYVYDINDKCFMKYVSKNRNYDALCYYAMNNHMYLIKDKTLVKSLVERSKNIDHKFNTSMLEFEEKANIFNELPIKVNKTIEEVKEYISRNKSYVFMYSRTTHNINDIFEQFITAFNIIPKITKCNKTNYTQFEYKKDKDCHFIFCSDPNDIHTITYKEVRKLCKKNNIEWKNQTYIQFVTEMKKKFFIELNGRITFTKEKHESIVKKFKFQCNKCKCKLKEGHYDIDHIKPLAKGGTNEDSNLQPLCKMCHNEKTQNEHEDGSFVRINDTESCFNSNVQEIIDSPNAQIHAFVQPIYYDKVQSDKMIYNIDINRCRKNILLYSESDYCVFTVFDKVEEYKQSVILPGLYYVETENILPLRGNGWYYHNMIDYCLENDIITKDNIKYTIQSSLTIPCNYYNKFIKYCDEHITEYNKLAINGMIGNFKPNVNKRANWKSMCITSDSCESFQNYINNDGCFIHMMNINDKKYYHVLKQFNKTNMETESPIYNQILQEEQIELHKLIKLVESKGGTVLDVNTDAVSCIFPDNKLPFKIVEDIQLRDQYWDKKRTVYKYKLEHKEDDKKRVKVAKMQNTQHIEQYILNKYYNWRVTPDVDDNDFKPLVDKIIASNQSWTIQGPAGAGKSFLIKGIQDALKSKEIEYISLAPTNLAALIIDGMTLHKFATKIRKYETLKNKTFQYIFVDEISMMKEIFYKFLLMIKKVKPDVKFILTGDYNQLLPINDRIEYDDYGNSPALFEICDSNKILLTKCRRSSKELFELLQIDNIQNLEKTDFNTTPLIMTDLHLAYTNRKRKEINDIMMKDVYKSKHYKGLKLEALKFDENSQDVILNKHTPVIAKINSEEIGIVNNERFEIIKYDTLQITMKNEKKEIKIGVFDFQRLFRVAYCITIHSSQGMSIDKPYTLHEWRKYDKRLKYVALSRARSKDLIFIKSGEKDNYEQDDDECFYNDVDCDYY